MEYSLGALSREKERATAMSRYEPHVDEPVSFVEGPPPAYNKGYSVKLKLFHLAARTLVFLILLIGSFILISAYIRSTIPPCECGESISSRLDADPLIAEPSSHVKLHIGEDLRKVKDKHHLNCLIERNEQTLNAIPPEGQSMVEVRGEHTIISCKSGGKRSKRSTPCDCNCAC